MIKRILLLLLIPTLLFGQINNWRDKTINQLSGMVSGTTDIGSKSYWETKAYNQIHDIIARLDTIRYATDFTNIDNAVSSLVNGGPLVCPAKTYNINASSLTIPSNVELIMEKGAILNGTTAKTVTINGQLRAGIYQIFGSNVTVTLDTGVVDVVYPEWWGLSSDSTDEDAFNAMWEALPEGRKGVVRLTGDYYFSDTWRLTQDSSNDSVGTTACHIVGYGSCIWSEADTTIYIELGYLAQSELIHKIEGVRIKGDGNEGGQDDRDVGTNIGIYIRDSGSVTVYNCALRNLGIGIQVSHRGPGWQAPFCDALRILYNEIVCVESGIVFSQDDTDNPSAYINFDQSIIEGNRIYADSDDSTDACIKLGDYTLHSRCHFTKNTLWAYNQASVYYLGGAIGGSTIEVWTEGESKSIFYCSPTWYEPSVTDATDDWTPYNVTITHNSGTDSVDVLNLSNFRFIYKKTVLSEGFGGYAFRDWTHNIPPTQLKTVSVTGGFAQNADIMANFQNISDTDTLITDISGNWRSLSLVGCTVSSVTATNWTTLSFDGTNDAVTTPSFTMDGNKMIITGFIPDSAYDATTSERLWKYYLNDSNVVFLDFCNGSGAVLATIYADNGVSTDSVSTTPRFVFNANEPLAIAVVIDTVNDEFNVWVNGSQVAENDYIGNLSSSSLLGNFTFGSEWGGVSGLGAFDIGFFAVFPYIDNQQIKDISKGILNVLNGNNYGEEHFETKGTDIASASTIKLTGGNFFDITGTTGIDSINTSSPQKIGAVIYLKFDDIVTVSNGKNLKLGSDFVSVADTVLTVIRDGNNFHRVR